jgi:hypothetical protein
MRISTSFELCEHDWVKSARHAALAFLSALMAATVFSAAAETTNTLSATNTPAATNAVVETPASEPAPAKIPERRAEGFDEASFRIVSERNIFDANRSGGNTPVRNPSFSSRPRQVDSFSLVGTMAYEKGAFAFFEGSSSQFTKVLKPDGLIAGHKLVEVYADSVKMDVDGKEIQLLIGSQLRREDEGTWHVAEGGGGSGSGFAANSSNGNGGESSSRYGSRSDRYGSSRGSDYRSRRGNDNDSSRSENTPASSSSPGAAAAAPSEEERNETLKKLMERRAKEDQ